MSCTSPNVNPSYQFFTSCLFSSRPYSFNAVNTSSSVNPKLSAYAFDVVVITTRLFKSENTDSRLTLVIPVIRARSKNGFVLKLALNRLLVNDTSCSQYPSTYASCIGVSYSSNKIITFFL